MSNKDIIQQQQRENETAKTTQHLQAEELLGYTQSLLAETEAEMTEMGARIAAYFQYSHNIHIPMHRDTEVYQKTS